MSTFAEQFQQLGLLLTEHRSYWHLLPFACTDIPWPDTELADQLQQLDEPAVTALEQDQQLRQQFFGRFFPALFSLPELAQGEVKAVAPVPFWLETGIGGRKLQQIDALCQQWLPEGLPIVEWCAGKGHLGRILAQRFQQPVTSVEWQQPLCDEGAKLADKLKLPQRFICGDVLTAPLQAVLQPEQHLVALHACGQLHIRLLEQAVTAQCRQLQLVPCCYHLIPTQCYQPLSQLAQQHDLKLTKEDLKLVVQGQATGGERINRLRHTEVLWRLAYDELRADISAEAEYKPLPSIAKHWFTADFASFAIWAAQQHGLVFPAEVSWQSYLERATTRHMRVRRIELVRHLFRRPLEIWLALDKALYLQQLGYQVRLTQLCQPDITPRNILISAVKPA